VSRVICKSSRPDYGGGRTGGKRDHAHLLQSPDLSIIHHLHHVLSILEAARITEQLEMFRVTYTHCTDIGCPNLPVTAKRQAQVGDQRAWHYKQQQDHDVSETVVP
jgi:hypothetical protein